MRTTPSMSSASEKGWFKDVGITITPEPDGLKTTENQWVSLLLNRQVDINSATCSNLLPSYKSTDQLKCVGFRGHVLRLRDVRQSETRVEAAHRLHDPGNDVEGGVGRGAQAIARQDGLYSDLDLGEGVHRGPVQTGRTRYAELRHDGRLADAAARQERPASTSCIPRVRRSRKRLLDAGWTPIYDIAQLVKFGPGGIDSPFEPLVFNNGWAATADYVDGHKTTMMRFASVVFRIFDALKKDPTLYRGLRALPEQRRGNLARRGRGSAHGRAPGSVRPVRRTDKVFRQQGRPRVLRQFDGRADQVARSVRHHPCRHHPGGGRLGGADV